MLSRRNRISAYSRIAACGWMFTVQRFSARCEISGLDGDMPSSFATRSSPLISQTSVRLPLPAHNSARAAVVTLFPVPPLPVTISSRLSSRLFIRRSRDPRERAEGCQREQLRLTARCSRISIAPQPKGGHAQEQSDDEAPGGKRRRASRQDRPATSFQRKVRGGDPSAGFKIFGREGHARQEPARRVGGDESTLHRGSGKPAQEGGRPGTTAVLGGGEGGFAVGGEKGVART